MVSLDQLIAGLRGSAFVPGQTGYDDARSIWNGMIDRRPALIVRCQGVADVLDAVNYARQERLGISIRGGGHHVAGGALNNDGLVIDLSLMRSVRVDPARRRVRVEGGAHIGDVDRETQAFGLAVPFGVVSKTGVAGLTLAGGIGWLRRKHGYTADNLIAADVVTADGRLLHTSREENADLFWALRGGGWDMGVVTSFEYEAHPLGPDVWVSLVFYPIDQAREAIRRYREFATGVPEGFNAIAVLWSFPEGEPFPAQYHGQPAFVIGGPYAGPVEEGERVTQPLRELGTPVIDLSEAMPYAQAQLLFDADYPDGLRYYWKSSYLKELSDNVIDILIDHTLKRPSPLSSLDMWLLGGALSRSPAGDSPIGHRDASYLIGVEANWEDAADDASNIAWTREVVRELAPFSTGGSYLNFEDLSESGAVAASHGGHFQRLVEIKRKYDPDNLFRSRRGLVD